MNNIIFKVAQWKLMWKENYTTLALLASLPLAIIGAVEAFIALAVKATSGTIVYGLLYTGMGAALFAVSIIIVSFIIDKVTNWCINQVNRRPK